MVVVNEIRNGEPAPANPKTRFLLRLAGWSAPATVALTIVGIACGPFVAAVPFLVAALVGGGVCFSALWWLFIDSLFG